MRYYPVFLDLAGQLCIVLGDGKFAVEKAAALGMEMVPSTPASSKKFYEQQMALWAPIVKASGAKVE